MGDGIGSGGRPFGHAAAVGTDQHREMGTEGPKDELTECGLHARLDWMGRSAGCLRYHEAGFGPPRRCLEWVFLRSGSTDRSLKQGISEVPIESRVTRRKCFVEGEGIYTQVFPTRRPQGPLCQ